GWIALACLIAATWSIAVPALLPRPRPSPAAVARRARAAVTAGRHSDRRVRALHAAVLALDSQLSTEDDEARLALCEVEHAVDRVLAGAGERAEVTAALARLESAVAGKPARQPGERPAPAAGSRWRWCSPSPPPACTCGRSATYGGRPPCPRCWLCCSRSPGSRAAWGCWACDCSPSSPAAPARSRRPRCSPRSAPGTW